ncbi:BCCT family transporter [Bernardetia sp. Wsw4-3y2]|uniref:BCCT family transporter n=1 Tax=Bernardetia sp. Wsw4-3y2 TaxID=3127471 RepID=UPI0030D15A08
MKNILLTLSLSILLFFSIFIFFDTTGFYEIVEITSLLVRQYFGRFYLYLGLFCVLFILGIALSPLGKRQLGNLTGKSKSDKKLKPEYSLWAWITMLYSAGMGAGILLRAVQEPVFMSQNPPLKTGISADVLALEYTFYQWGFTAWAFYGLFALLVGYYFFEKKKPILVSATLGDLPKNTSSKVITLFVDVLAILTTIFGLVGAIALGTTQINGGLNHLYGNGITSSFGFETTILLTVLICGLAFLSVWNGIDKGIKIISKANIAVTAFLLLFIVVQSDFLEVMILFAKAFFHYIIDFIPLSVAIGKYNAGEEFLTDWTYYYWAFWLAWSPFTGIFIARISQGRTIRQMILGVLILPSLGTFIWFAFFANSAFVFIDTLETYQNEFGNVFTSLFVFLSNYPLSSLTNFIVVLLLISFLVTSVDSAVFVLSMFTDDGKSEPKRSHRLIWSIFIVVFAIAVLLLGQAKPDIDVLTALQKLLIITSLPFALLMPIMSFIFLRNIYFDRKNKIE